MSDVRAGLCLGDGLGVFERVSTDEELQGRLSQVDDLQDQLGDVGGCRAVPGFTGEEDDFRLEDS